MLPELKTSINSVNERPIIEQQVKQDLDETTESDLAITYCGVWKETIITTFYNSAPILAEPVFNFINGIIIAQISEEALSASGLIFAAQNLFIIAPCFVIGSISGLASTAYGAKRYNRINKLLNSGLIFSFAFSIPNLVLAINSHFFLKFAGVSEKSMELYKSYFYFYCAGIPAQFMLYSEREVILGVENYLPVNLISFIDNLSGTILGYILTHYKFNIYKYRVDFGIEGFGAAFAISSWINLLGFSFYIKYSPRFRDFSITFFKRTACSITTLKKIAALGLPAGVAIGSEFLALTALSIIIGRLGDDPLSSYQISMQCTSLTILPAYCFSQSALLLTSRAVGKNQYLRAKYFGNICILLGVSCSMITFGLLMAMPKQFTSLFIDIDDPEDAAIVSSTQTLLIINGISQIIDSARIISASTLQGTFENTKVSMYAGITGMFGISTTLGYSLGSFTKLGSIGVCLARSAGLLVSGATVLTYWFIKLKNFFLHQNDENVRSNDLSSDTEDTASSQRSFEETLLDSQSEISDIPLRITPSPASFEQKDKIISGYRKLADGERSEQSKSPLLFSENAILPKYGLTTSLSVESINSDPFEPPQGTESTSDNITSDRSFCVIL